MFRSAFLTPSQRWKILAVFCSVQITFFRSLLFVCAQETKDLYTDQDHMVNFNRNNFNSKFFGKQNVFILEFYNSWCGYCIGFAPTWKAFAEDVRGWKTVAQVAALNCAQEENVELCRNYKVVKYPSLRYFWTDVQPGDFGSNTTHPYEVEKLRHDWLDYIQAQWKRGVPAGWPDLEPVKANSLEEIWKKSFPSSRDFVILIVEDETSYIGREVILDLSASDAKILRILSTNSQIINELRRNVDLPSFPALFLLNRAGNVKLFSSASNTPREDFRNIIQRDILHKIILPDIVVPTESPFVPDKNSSVVPNHVDMADLENTLYHILKKEVVLQEMLEGERLDALKSFLRLLNYYFPGREPVKKFLHNLYLQLTVRRSRHMLATEFSDLMASLQTSDSFLPPMTDWVGCKSSVPKYRGYSCGLWTLFHVLTAEAYQQYLERKHDDIKIPEGVLVPIKNYILNFFSCSECAQNFAKESATLDTDIKFKNDTVLWLWWTHNIVNKRLAGDRSEDPNFPKVQFPPVTACSKCHLKGSTKEKPLWNETGVLEFLLNHYTNVKNGAPVDKDSESHYLGFQLLQPLNIFTSFIRRGTIFLF